MRVGQVQGGFTVDSNLGKTAEGAASLEKAVALFTEVYRARPSDPEARADLARAKIILAVPVTLTNPARAEELRKEVIALSSGGGPPGLMERAQFAKALAYFGIAERHAKAGRIQQSLEARNQCIDVLQAVLAENPRYEDAERILSSAYKRRAALYVSPMGELDKAGADLKLALSIDDRRVAQDPTNAVAKFDRALGESYSSVVLRRQKDFAASDQMIHRAIAARTELLRADPGNIRNRTWLMGDYEKLAALKRAESKLPESMEAIEKGFEVARQAEERLKSNHEWRSFSGVLHFGAAQTRAMQGACQDAADHLVQARQLDTEPEHDLRQQTESAVAACGKSPK